MKRIVIGLSAFALLTVFAADPALALTHHKGHHKVHHKIHKVKKVQKDPAQGPVHPAMTGVRGIQTKLSMLGHYTFKIDGVWGPLTENGLMAFQREKHLFVSGRATRETMAALNAAVERSRGMAIPVAFQGGLGKIACYLDPWQIQPKYCPE